MDRARRMIPRIAVTVGEPAGVGPELVAVLAQAEWNAHLVAIGDPGCLREAAARRGLALACHDFDPDAPAQPHRPGTLCVRPVPLAAPAEPGRLDSRNAVAVLAMLADAADLAQAGTVDAVVTAPVHKGVLADTGAPFSGHTEFFAERAGSAVLMLLVAPGLRVALATTHLPLHAVPAAINRAGIERSLRILHAGLQRDFGIARPRIDVLGLNPHAGEGGHLGREEIEVISPVLAHLRAAGFDVRGPLPADTAFVPARLADADAFFAMYHDQGLPVLKARGFGAAVNVTLGLPWVRTSVDHGTALDIAGTGTADASSLAAALNLAIELGARRRAAGA
jgi:4-hydroxythreonine-4-phosphate dehydrogenase